jgi:predicted AlkP superfamily pyrophosphatase or phosphodiesterase
MAQILRQVVLAGLVALSSWAQIAPRDRVVLIVSVDGLPGWAWEDPRLPTPNLQRLAREGVRAAGMTPPNPTVTWPSHTTMVTGVSPARHGVLFNGIPVRQGERGIVKVEPWRLKEELVLAPTVYDKLQAAGFTTAEVDWVAINRAKTITWRFPEIPDPDGPIEQEMVQAGIISRQDLAEFFKSSPAWRDYYWTQAGAHILRRRRPNLLLFHLLNTDAVNHTSGPRSYASQSAYALADTHVGMLLDALEKEGIRERATVFVVSDHGFKTAKRIIQPNAVLRREGLLETRDGVVTCDAFALPQGGTAMVYVTNSARRRELVPKLAAVFSQTEGIARVLAPGDFAALGLPEPVAGDRMADLLLAAGDGYAFNSANQGAPVVAVHEGGYPGHHGYPNADAEMQATFLAWGNGIRRGTRIGMVSAADVAPTVAHLFGLKMENVEGRILREILAE